MNQYIITEEDVKEFSKLIDILEQTGRTSDNADFDVMYAWRNIEENLRSHPYQSERDKVLDELKSVYEAKVRKTLGVLRPQVLYFALRMEEKLRKHDKERGSRGWVGYTQPEEQKYLFRRLVEEVKELENAITRANACGEPLVRGSSENVDVGNFAMMLYTAYYGDDTAKNMIDYMLEELRQAGEP